MIVLYVLLGIIIFIFIVLHFSIVAEATFSNEKKDIKVKFLFFTIYPLKEKVKKVKKKPKKPKKSKKPKKLKNKRKKEKLLKKLEKEKQDYKNALIQADKVSNRENAFKEFLPKSEGEVRQNIEKVVEKNLGENLDKQTSKTNEKPNSKGKTEKEKKKIKQKKDKKEKSENNKFDELKAKWEKIKPFIPIGKKVIKKLVKAIRISDLDLQLAVANEDAYECAMAYGKTNIAVFNTLAVLKIFFTVKVKRINITSKFNSADTEYDFYCKIKTRPSTIIAIAVSTLVNYLYIVIKKKREDKKENKN